MLYTPKEIASNYKIRDWNPMAMFSDPGPNNIIFNVCPLSH
jgi:hypothetical protein